VSEGKTAKPDLVEGIGTVGLMTAMERSLETGKPVRVQSVLEEHGLGDVM
jgi:hypothetical protein